MQRFICWLLGGRPMTALDEPPFIDVVSGHTVRYWQDRYGRQWMAEGPWSGFRVPVIYRR